MTDTARVKCPQCTYATSAGSLPAHVAMAHKDAAPVPEPAPVRPSRKPRAAKPAPTAKAIEVKPVAEPTAPEGGYPTREAWMLAAVEAFRPTFEELDVEVPQVRISVGWPGGRGNKQHVVGQCWMPEAVADGLPAIFVSPVQADPVDVLETVLHELIHAAGNRGHRGGFAKLARVIGFKAPFKSTPSTDELKAELTELAAKLGPWPHARVNAGGGKGTAPAAPPVQSTRMIRCRCPECGYTLRTTQKWIDVAVPTCPVDDAVMEVG